MQIGLLARTAILFLAATCFALALQNSVNNEKTHHDKIHQNKYEVLMRTKRATSRPGFFRTLFSVIYEQWNDTRNTFGTVNQLINDNFLPDNAPVTEATTATSSDPNISTTTEPYKITRAEFNRILRRNLRGLQRLFDIELQDALRQSEKNNAEFRRNTSLEVSKFL